MFRSIRWTLQIWHASILLIALFAFGSALYVGVDRLESRRVDAELEGAARVLASGPIGGRGPPPMMMGEDRPPDRRQPPPEGDQREGPRDGPRDGPHEGPRDGPRDRPPPARPPAQWWAAVPRDALRRLGRNEADQPYFAIFSGEGTLIRASLAAPEAEALAPTERPGPRDGPAVFRNRAGFREVIVAGPMGIRVLVGKSMQPEQAELSHLRLVLLGAGAAVMAIGLLGGWLLSQRATRPIRAITATARLISASNLSKRIDVDETTSELGSLARTLNETFERLETSFARQVRFTADASHELRTPLSVIHTNTELALTRDRPAAEYRQTIETCLRAAKRMKSLVETLLVLARADAGQLELKREPLDLSELAEECLALAAPQAQEQKITLESNLKSVKLSADRTRLSQLITNLLNNAVRYNRPDGTVNLSIKQDGSQAIITVADTGVGITAEDQPRVFERFFRADKARSRDAGGSGLGLAICQSIVEAHGGTITFTSQSGAGTTFSVRLPIQ